jgi:hypothetical protein
VKNITCFPIEYGFFNGVSFSISYKAGQLVPHEGSYKFEIIEPPPLHCTMLLLQFSVFKILLQSDVFDIASHDRACIKEKNSDKKIHYFNCDIKAIDADGTAQITIINKDVKPKKVIIPPSEISNHIFISEDTITRQYNSAIDVKCEKTYVEIDYEEVDENEPYIASILESLEKIEKGIQDIDAYLSHEEKKRAFFASVLKRQTQKEKVLFITDSGCVLDAGCSSIEYTLFGTGKPKRMSVHDAALVLFVKGSSIRWDEVLFESHFKLKAWEDKLFKQFSSYLKGVKCLKCHKDFSALFESQLDTKEAFEDVAMKERNPVATEWLSTYEKLLEGFKAAFEQKKKAFVYKLNFRRYSLRVNKSLIDRKSRMSRVKPAFKLKMRSQCKPAACWLKPKAKRGCSKVSHHHPGTHRFTTNSRL